jgi:hypothetical protein
VEGMKDVAAFLAAVLSYNKTGPKYVNPMIIYDHI